MRPPDLSRLPAAVLGVLVGLVVAAVVLSRVPSKPLESPPPEPLGGPPLSEFEGPIAEVLFHYVPEMEAELRAPYSDLLRSLPGETRLAAVVPDGGGKPALERFLDSIDPSLVERTRILCVPGPISPWSKDRALVLGPGPTTAEHTLLTPVAPPREWSRRRNDWRATLRFAATREDVVARQLPLAFDAGDFAVTGQRIIVDANLLTKNLGRRMTTPADLERTLEPLLGQDVVVLGRADGDVPRHHLSMYMAPLGSVNGQDTVLVGDPRLARDIVGDRFVPGETDPDSGRPLVADFSPTMIERHDRAAHALAHAGFHIVRIPTVPFLDKTYMAYTNGVFGTWGSQKIAWMPSFDLPELDARARAVYESLGWEVRTVRVRSVYAYHGTIGCLVNVIVRGTDRA